MSSKLSLFIVTTCLLFTTGCAPRTTTPTDPPHDSSINSLDWAGTYTAYLPCADCAGIETSLTLNSDMSWLMVSRYDTGSDNRTESRGKFSWETDGNHIRLNGVTNAPNRYKVEENRLVQLDMQGNRIEGPLADRYILTKGNPAVIPAPAGNLFDVRWQLVEMMGNKPSAPATGLPHIQFAPETNSIVGFGGCNQFSGTYELLSGNRLRFSQMVSTMMACADMSTETEMLKLLDTVDNYSLNNNRLSLNRARMAPLLVFEALPVTH